MTRPARAVIDQTALRANLQRIHTLSPGHPVIAVIKANAYGHGLANVLPVLDGVDALGVACLDEALQIRALGYRQPVVVLEGFFAGDEIGTFVQQGFQAVIHDRAQVDMLEQARVPGRLRCWVKVDSGMHRLGFLPAELDTVIQRLSACDAVEPELNLMTHLAAADDRESDQTTRQLAQFAGCHALPANRLSIANSAAVLAWPEARVGWLRPGLMLYGASPFAGRCGADDGLSAVMSLNSALIAVHRRHKGDPIGYGADWTCPEDMPVGIVAIGYGDGYPRHAPSGTPVRLGGSRVALIGRVSMDMIAVDLRPCPDARAGDPVQLWGPDLPIEEIARCAGTLAYELMCGVTARVPVDVSR